MLERQQGRRKYENETRYQNLVTAQCEESTGGNEVKGKDIMRGIQFPQTPLLGGTVGYQGMASVWIIMGRGEKKEKTCFAFFFPRWVIGNVALICCPHRIWDKRYKR